MAAIALPLNKPPPPTGNKIASKSLLTCCINSNVILPWPHITLVLSYAWINSALYCNCILFAVSSRDSTVLSHKIISPPYDFTAANFNCDDDFGIIINGFNPCFLDAFVIAAAWLPDECVHIYCDLFLSSLLI